MIDFVAMCEKLQDADLGRIGESICFDTMPVSAKRGLLIRSNTSGDPIDYEIPGLAKGTFRLIARSVYYEDGRDLLNDAIRALLVTRPTQIGTMNVRYCRPVATPMNFPLSDGNLREFAVKMEICYDYDVSQCAWMDHVVK